VDAASVFGTRMVPLSLQPGIGLMKRQVGSALYFLQFPWFKFGLTSLLAARFTHWMWARGIVFITSLLEVEQ
jgi:hypothetical protein